MTIKIFQKILIFTIHLLIVLNSGSFAQSDRSKIIEKIDGTDYYLHFVKAGETLFTIAKTYNTTVDEIHIQNSESRDGIRSGMILKIPVESKSKTEEKVTTTPIGDFTYHTVQKQETLFAISRKYGITVQIIKDMNPDTGEHLKEGEILKIPRLKEVEKQAEPSPDLMIKHTVGAGETFYSVAQKYNITTKSLANANPGITPENISIGQSINIPGSGYNMTGESQSKTNDEPVKFTEHVVLKGETLYSISRQYAVSIDILKQYNSGLEYSLFIGQKIKVPVIQLNPDFILYTPDKTETLDKIAEKHQLETYEVTEANPEVGKKAKKGQQIKIPVDQTDLPSEDMVDPDIETNIAALPCGDHQFNHDKPLNIALMIPLFLEETDSLTKYHEKDFSQLTNHNSFRFLNFYAGFLMAVDSIKKQGIDINLYVYDVDNSDKKLNAVINKPELNKMDLIVGPLYARSFASMAAYAKSHKIPIVNPLSTREEVVLDNPFVFKLKPSDDVQTEILLAYILDHYKTSNIIIIRQNQYQYQAPASYLRNNLNNRRPGQVGIANSEIVKLMSQKERKNLFTENKVIDFEKVNRNLKDSTYLNNYVKELIYRKDSTLGLKMSLSTVRHNLIIAFSEDIVFSKEILSQLNKQAQTHEITMFGIPDWHAYNDLETNHLLNLKLHSFTSSLVNYEDENTKRWIEAYRQRFKREPTESNYAFDGFDAGWYFLNALYFYGSDFYECINQFSLPLLQTRFRFEHKEPNGFRNIYWSLGTFENYKFKRVKTR